MRASGILFGGLLALTAAACSESSGGGLPSDCRGAADGTTCDDGSICTTASECQGGECVGTAEVGCITSDPCLVAFCEDGACATAPAPDGALCADANPETCEPAGLCRAGVCERPALDCPDVAGCQVRTWSGEDWALAAVDDGTICEDGDPCTDGDTCFDGLCQAGDPTVCTASGPCTRALCDPETGCVEESVRDGTPCEDSDLCTLETVCSGGACVATREVECLTGSCIESSACVPETGRCEFAFVADDTPCDDRDICTEGDHCMSGNCSPRVELPFDAKPCTEGICFQEVAAAAGLDFRGRPPIVNAHGAAVALFDMDGDGDLDIAAATETTPIQLYENRGQLRFENVTEGSGLDGVVQSASARLFAIAVGDIDNDGDSDLYLGMQDVEDYLFENEGNGTFTDVTAESGLAGTLDTNGADFGDFDNDGDLDLIVGNYIKISRFPNHVPEPNQLYMNLGDGRFEDVTTKARVGGGDIGGEGTTLIVRWSDYDRDGDLDLFECNDFGANVGKSRLYQNTGKESLGERFIDVSEAMNMDLEIYCMSVTTGDHDRDGDIDYYFTNIGRHQMFENRAPAPFVEVTDAITSLQYDQCRVDELAAGWSALWVDLDQDGWLDLFSANGHVNASDEFVNSEVVRNSVLKHDGPSLTYTDITRSTRAGTQNQSRGAAAGDLDGDGDLDIVVGNMIGPLELFENVSPDPGGYMVVDVRGTSSNRDGYHAFIEVFFEDGTRMSHEVDPHVGYQGVSQKAAHFGLGPGSHPEDVIDELRVTWPATGIEQNHYGYLGWNSTQTLVEPSVTLDAVTVLGAWFAGQTTPVQFDVTNHGATNKEIQLSLLHFSDDRVNAVVPPGKTTVDLEATLEEGSEGTWEFLFTLRELENGSSLVGVGDMVRRVVTVIEP